jgi:hypothetical protein
MATSVQDEIVETRTWSGGVEIVSHINWSHIARVRRVLGVAGDEVGRNAFVQPSRRPTLVLHETRTWSGAPTRAA